MWLIKTTPLNWNHVCAAVLLLNKNRIKCDVMMIELKMHILEAFNAEAISLINPLRTTGRLVKTNEVSIFKPIRGIVRMNVLNS